MLPSHYKTNHIDRSWLRGYGVFTLSELLGVSLLQEAVKSTILTGRVANSDNGPLSMLLISEPESGKTSIVQQKSCKSVMSFTDITGRGITDTLKSNPQVSHLIILDMVAIMSHRQTVNNYTVAVLNAMTEEGVGNIAYPGSSESFENGKRGLIACLTRDMLRDGRSWWNKTGFATRLLPICFEHSAVLTQQVISAISSGKSYSHAEKNKEEFPVPDTMINVELPTGIGKEIEWMSQLKAQEFKEKGYRRLKQLRAMIKGHALLRSWKKPVCNKDDMDFMRRISPYISFDRAAQI